MYSFVRILVSDTIVEILILLKPQHCQPLEIYLGQVKQMDINFRTLTQSIIPQRVLKRGLRRRLKKEAQINGDPPG